MSEVLPELEQKKDLLKKLADEHVRKRDSFSSESHYYAEERDKLNQKTKSMREAVLQKISEKSALIEKVQKLRDQKEQVFQDLKKLREKIREQKKNFRSDEYNPTELKKKEKELKRLEDKQQTTELSKDDENKIVLQIRKLANEIKIMKTKVDEGIQQSKSYKEISDEINKRKEEYDKLKAEIDAISKEINRLGEEINNGLLELDENKKKADEFHELFIKNNKEAEKEHQEFIKVKKDLKEVENMIHSLSSKNKATKKKEKEGELQTKAVELYNKFINGEQLTTDDLLILQKAGLL